MSFRYQRRINFGGGWGFNLSLRGVSSSYRSKWGSVGPRGFSFRTGIPGLSFHQSWKGFGVFDFIILLGLIAINLVVSIIWTLIEVVFIYLLPIAIQLLLWCIYFIIDRLKSDTTEFAQQSSYISNTNQTNTNPNLIVGNKNQEVLPNELNDIDLLHINESGKKFKIVINKLKDNLNFGEYLKKCNLTSYGHLLSEESIIEHIVYADIYRLLSLSKNQFATEKVFFLLEDSIRGLYKDRGEPTFFVNSKLNNLIIDNVTGLNAVIFKMYEEESGVDLYCDIEPVLYSLQFCLIGMKYEEWRIQVRNLASDPYQELNAKVFYGFR